MRQTSDATIDSRFLVAASDLALRKAKSGGDNTAGVDIDEFVSKCISFMRNGGRPTRHSAEREGREQDDDEAPRSTQRHTSNNRRTSRHVDDDEEADEDGDALPWHIFGARAAFPCNKRPPVPSFLLGPLSVQKRVRAQTQRTQRTARNAPQEPVSRPQELRAEDFATQENNNLTALCKKIHNRLMEVEDVGKVAVDEVFQPHNNLTEEEAEQAALAKCKEMHLAMNPEDNEPGVPLFEFAIHPTSFGQSVENLFYVSFLIRDGHAMLFYDEHKLPVLRRFMINDILSSNRLTRSQTGAIREQRSIEESRRENVKKRQAIISLDYPSWRQLIDVFDITKPLIPHREPQVQDVGRAGWYG